MKILPPKKTWIFYAIVDEIRVSYCPKQPMPVQASGRFSAASFGIVVVDEADHRLEATSAEIGERILEMVVQDRPQLISCSATFPDEIRGSDRISRQSRPTHSAFSIDYSDKSQNRSRYRLRYRRRKKNSRSRIGVGIGIGIGIDAFCRPHSAFSPAAAGSGQYPDAFSIQHSALNIEH